MSQNPYAYAEHNPINYTDPSGNEIITAAAVMAAAALTSYAVFTAPASIGPQTGNVAVEEDFYRPGLKEELYALGFETIVAAPLGLYKATVNGGSKGLAIGKSLLKGSTYKKLPAYCLGKAKSTINAMGGALNKGKHLLTKGPGIKRIKNNGISPQMRMIQPEDLPDSMEPDVEDFAYLFSMMQPDELLTRETSMMRCFAWEYTLTDIVINNGVATTTVDIAMTLDPGDIALLKSYLKAKGVRVGRIESGPVLNAKLKQFLQRRADDGRLVHGMSVKPSADTYSDFVLEFEP